MIDVGYLAAFLGGLLALLSPCSALLLPSLFAYAFGGATRMLARTGVFFVGLAAVMVPLGAGSSGLAVLLTENRQVLITLAGAVLIALGTVQILGGGWSVGPAARLQQRMAARGTWLSTVGLGAAYGLTGFCTGPILGAVLTVAAAGGNPVRGAVLLAVYALGMAAPLFALAAAWQRLDLGHRRWLRGRSFRVGRVRLHTTSLTSGSLFIAIGVGFVYLNGTAALPSLDPHTASAVENTVAGLASHVSDATLLLVLAAFLAAAIAYRRRHVLNGSHARHTHSAVDVDDGAYATMSRVEDGDHWPTDDARQPHSRAPRRGERPTSASREQTRRTPR